MDDTVATRPALAQLQGLTRLIRPKQWVKNGFVLAPLFFTGEFLDSDAVSRALLATVLFCIASSATYIVNDMHDIESDRRHPVKCRTRLHAGSAAASTSIPRSAAQSASAASTFWSSPSV